MRALLANVAKLEFLLCRDRTIQGRKKAIGPKFCYRFYTFFANLLYASDLIIWYLEYLDTRN